MSQFMYQDQITYWHYQSAWQNAYWQAMMQQCASSSPMPQHCPPQPQQHDLVLRQYENALKALEEERQAQSDEDAAVALVALSRGSAVFF